MYFDYYSARTPHDGPSPLAPGMNPDGQYPSMQVMPPYSPMSPDVNYPRPATNMPAPGMEQTPGMQPTPGMAAPGMQPAPGMPQTGDMNNKEKTAMGHELPMMYGQQANMPFMPYNVGLSTTSHSQGYPNYPGSQGYVYGGYP